MKRKKNEFTRREIEVVSFVLRGLSNIEISKRLKVKEKTIKFHMTNILAKQKCKSRMRLMVKLLAAKVVAVKPKRRKAK